MTMNDPLLAGVPESERPTGESVSYHRSSLCPAASCVEVGVAHGLIYVRDSKHPERMPLVFTMDEWVPFVNSIKIGEFDFPSMNDYICACIEQANEPAGEGEPVERIVDTDHLPSARMPSQDAL